MKATHTHYYWLPMLTVIFLIGGCRPESVAKSPAIVVSSRSIENVVNSGPWQMDQISKSSGREREQRLENYVADPYKSASSKFDLLLSYGTKEQKETFFPQIALKINWKTISIGPSMLPQVKPYLSTLRTNPEFDKAVYRGIGSRFSSQVKATNEEFSQMDFDQLVELCEADAYIFQSKHKEALAQADLLLRKAPDNEVFNEFYIICLRRASGWKATTKWWETAKNRIHNPERIVRMNLQTTPNSTVIWHTPKGDIVNRS